MRHSIRAGLWSAALALTAAGQPFRSDGDLPLPRIRLDSNLVLAPVTVTNDRGKLITDLPNEAFTILENGRAQRIASVSREVAPISLGIVVDTSGSMAGKWAATKIAIASLIGSLEDADEMFLVTFADSPSTQTEFTQDSGEIAARLGALAPAGSTALYDAVLAAVRKMRRASPGRRKALVLVSDGGDNHSRATEREVRRLVEEEDVQVHAIGIHDTMGDMEEKRGPWLLEDLAEMTGGQHYMVRDAGELPRIATRIGLALHQHYVVAYQPNPPGLPGEFRRITVKVRAAGSFGSLRVYARKGYRTPEP